MKAQRRVVRWRLRSRGFTVVELGVTLGVIGILATIVMISRGMLSSAKVSNAVQMVNTLRQSARSYSQRYCRSVSFGGGPCGANVLSLGSLQGDNLVPVPFQTPWNTGVNVAPYGADTTYIQIDFCTGDAMAAQDVCTLLFPGSVPPTPPSGCDPNGGGASCPRIVVR